MVTPCHYGCVNKYDEPWSYGEYETMMMMMMMKILLHWAVIGRFTFHHRNFLSVDQVFDLDLTRRLSGQSAPADLVCDFPAPVRWQTTDTAFLTSSSARI